jgi:uncharacterized protein YydD (DUF2326 family)
VITIKKFYIEEAKLPSGKIFKPIEFDEGINIILGERSSKKIKKTQQEKMNSVGKSLLVEMINYCLLKDESRSRVGKVPFDVLPTESWLCLDLEYESGTEVKKISIRRSRDDRKGIVIEVDEEKSEFSEKEIDKAKEYLGHYFFNIDLKEHPTLRKLLGILIRNEKSGFDDILYPNGRRQSSYADIIKTHLYLFGIDISTIDNISKINKDIDKVKTVASHARSKITAEKVKVSEVRSYINELEREVKKLDVAASAMKPSAGASKLIDDLNKFSSELEQLITRKSAKESLAKKIKAIPNKNQSISSNDIKNVYEKYKEGLGDLVSTSFEETLKFRSQIDEFENELLTEKLSAIAEEIRKFDTEINDLDDRISTIYNTIGYAERVTDFRVAIKEQDESQRQLDRLREDYDLYERKTKEKKQLTTERESKVNEIDNKVFEMSAIIKDFEKHLISIHEAIYDNATCHFDIKVDTGLPKEYVRFDYRTYLDRGASSDRTKILIYDVLLMLDEHTSKRHPKFLIHDNVFSAVGKNDMVNALNYLDDRHNKGAKFQYIITINKDEFEAQEAQLKFTTEGKKRVTLTREDPLLGQKYAEND